MKDLVRGGQKVAAALSEPTCDPVRLITPRDYHEFARAQELILSGARRQLGLDDDRGVGRPLVSIQFGVNRRAEGSESAQVVDVEEVTTDSELE